MLKHIHELKQNTSAILDSELEKKMVYFKNNSGHYLLTHIFIEKMSDIGYKMGCRIVVNIFQHVFFFKHKRKQQY